MKKIATLTLAAWMTVIIPAYGQTTADVADKAQDVQSDAAAVSKDNTALQHDNQNLQANRAAKAADKANGNWAGQAVDSTKIGANKIATSEKSVEKNYDTDQMKSDSSTLNTTAQQQQ